MKRCIYRVRIIKPITFINMYVTGETSVMGNMSGIKKLI